LSIAFSFLAVCAGASLAVCAGASLAACAGARAGGGEMVVVESHQFT
jgi:hypothetical protein